ncbi:MAG: hypothetical protein AABY64_03700 [Bdellovibrionota bacterium]
MKKHNSRTEIFLVLFLVLITTYVHAQEVPEPESTARVGGPEKGLNLRFIQNFGVQSYSLAGTGFTGDLNATATPGSGLQLLYVMDKMAIRAEFNTKSTEFKPPSTLTPSLLTSKTNAGFIETNFYPYLEETGWKKTLYYGFGLDSLSRTAIETSPNVILTPSTRIGFRGSVGQTANLSKIFQLETTAWLTTPFVFEESGTKTGYKNYSALFGLKLMFIYHVSHFIDFSLGLNSTYEMTTYKGTGTRAVTDGSETYTNLTMPIELRFQF